MSGKKYKKALAGVDRTKRYAVEEAMTLLEQTKTAKFDEMVDLAIRLGVDPKQSDQMVRGAVTLPHGVGKGVRVIAFAKGQKQEEAEKAGAIAVGGEDLVEKITKGWLDFDKAIATPDMMGVVSKLGRILGPRGQMPNPKLGTVTFDVAQVVKELQAGRVEFKIDKCGVIHTILGKVSFGAEKLKDNFLSLINSIIRAKPSTSKGNYLRSVTVSTTMGPGIKIDPNQLQSN
ncbi:MAG: 50S ribosomal protein L1 [Deltaproteobacteria bacterium]|nr:50S ribosomal protein L1 [Deltaproteobacteria bacterium]MBI2500308.1 50S ribosomal protein L1 [Deltaproteobacteria bacterium]MBI4196987.1 50S ribosomal protein L1 [Deltaproteobacteria bacterium]